MNVKIYPKPTPSPTEFVIEANGLIIGTISKSLNSSDDFHAVIKSKIDPVTLYQGFGPSVDDAMKDAIIRHRIHCKQQLSELNKLEDIIWGDDETN